MTAPANQGDAAGRLADLTAANEPWDVVVVGGGITGAAIFHQLARAGVRVLLLEQRDYAWGTSSRSSKLVHGGFRYLAQGHLRLVRDAARERVRLMADAPGLVTPVDFMFAGYRADRPGFGTMRMMLAVYEALSGVRNHKRFSPADLRTVAPQVRREALVGGLSVREGVVDDARLVLRLITEGIAAGGVARNYAQVASLLRAPRGIRGVRVAAEDGGDRVDVEARVVVNATGIWADRLREEVGAAQRIRPLRGSHLIIPAWRLPVAQVVAFRHPIDRRYVSVVPWEGVSVVGTTDHPQVGATDAEAAITAGEFDYLLAGVEAMFPGLALGPSDVISTFSGLRPVLDSRASDSTRASREHLVVEEEGLITVTGGKLTTFRLIAREALELIRGRVPRLASAPKRMDESRDAGSELGTFAPAAVSGAARNPLDEFREVAPAWLRIRLAGRYGAMAPALLRAAQVGEMETIPGTPTPWVELRWAARAEQVAHLDDLLLRRTRVGLLAPDGFEDQLPRVASICSEELGWDPDRWSREVERYRVIHERAYSVPAERQRARPSPLVG